MLHLLRFLHVGIGVFWAGAVLLFGFFVFPTVRALGPAGGPVMDQLVRVRKMPVVLMTAGILTVLSGLVLYRIDSLHFQSDWIRSGPGIGFSIGGIAGLLAAVVGMVVSGPTAKRAGELAGAIRGAGGPPKPEQAAEMERLQVRLGRSVRTVSVLMIIAVAFMSVARYL